MKSTIKDLYESISSIQNELRCERSMHQVESYTKDEYLKRIKNKYYELLQNEKNYFLQFFNIMTHNSSPLFQSNVLINKENISPDIHILPFPLFDQLVKDLIENGGNKLKDKNVQFYLSYSLFPALASYFTIDFITNNLNSSDQISNNFMYHDYNEAIKFLVNEVKTKNDQNCKLLIELLMRPMFSSPYFVRFVTETFQPPLSELLDKLEEETRFENEKLFEDCFKNIEDNMDKNLHLIPSYIVYTIQFIEHPDEILEKCFLDLALENPEQSIAFGLFHYSKRPDKELLDKIKKMIFHLKYLIDRMLSCFCQSLLSRTLMKTKSEENFDLCPSFDLLFSSEEEKEEYSMYKNENLLFFSYFMFQKKEIKHLFQNFILSRTDVNLLNYINNHDDTSPFKVVDEKTQYKFYPFFLCFPNDDYVFKSNNDDEFDFSTMRDVYNGDNITPSLRHLLQSADQLPQFIDGFFPEDLDVEKLFMNYLVQRGEISTISTRMKYKSNIFIKLKDKNEDERINEIMETLPKTLLELTDEIELLTAASLIEQRYQGITNFVLCFTTNQINLLNNFIIFDKSRIAKQINVKNKLDYIENPNLIEELFERNIKNISEGKETGREKNVFVLLKMVEKKKSTILYKDCILFNELKKYCIKNKPDVIQFDNDLKNYLDNQFDEMIDYLIEQQFPCHSTSKSKNNVNSNENANENENSNSNENDNDNENSNNNENARNNDETDYTKGKKFDKSKFLFDKINKIRNEDKGIICLIKESLLESSIFRKYELFVNFYTKVRMYFRDGYPRDADFGSDEMTSIISILILMCNTPNIQLNIEYLNLFMHIYEYCFSELFNEYSIYLEGAKRIFNSYCQRNEKNDQ